MKQYSGWQALFFSLWSSSLYRDVAKEWRGVGYLYLFLLVCLAAFFVSLQVQVVFVPATKPYIDALISQMPNITVDRGTLSIDKPSPYKVKTVYSSNPVMVFDTRSKPMTIEESNCVCLVTNDALYVKRPSSASGAVHQKTASAPNAGPGSGEETSVERYSLNTIEHFSFVVNDWRHQLDLFFKWLGTIIFVIWVPFAFAFCVCQTLLYGLLGKVFCSLLSVNLSYPTLIRLSSVALTPVLLLDSLQKAASLDIHYWPLISIAVALGYLYFAVYSNREGKSQIPSATEVGPG